MKASFDALPTPPAPETGPAHAPSLGPSLGANTTPKIHDWAKAVGAVSHASSRYGTALSHARLIYLQPPVVCLAFSPQAGFHKNSVFVSGRATIETALSEFFKCPIQLVEDNSANAYASAQPSPVEQQTKRQESQTRKLETKVHAHPRIQAALAILEGHVEFIRPLDTSTPARVASFDISDEDDD